MNGLDFDSQPKRAKINSLEQTVNQKRSFSMRKISKLQNFKVQETEPNIIVNAKQSNDLMKSQSQRLLTTCKQKSPNKSRWKNYSSKLSPIKQYETRLKISAETWLVYDYRKDSYKRGWRPAQAAEFSGFSRLLVLRAFLDMLKIEPSLKNFNVRVNTSYLKEEVEMSRQQKLPAHKQKGMILRESMTRGLENNIMINFIDLMFGLFMTNYDDILEYAIVFMGHICHCLLLKLDLAPEDSPCYFIDKITEAEVNSSYFQQYLQLYLFPGLEMSTSKFIAQTYTFESCANDICRLYLSLEDHSFFKEIYSCKELTCKIKYQIGFRYWENRTMIFRNRRLDLGPQYEFVANWKSKKNYCVISRNRDLNILIVLEDCKFGMADSDIFHIELWVKQLMKPVVDRRKTHAKLLPLLRITQSPNKHNLNWLQQSKLTPISEENEQINVKNF